MKPRPLTQWVGIVSDMGDFCGGGRLGVVYPNEVSDGGKVIFTSEPGSDPGF